MPQSFNIKAELKRLAQHGAVYGVAGMLSRLVGFLMIPVYTQDRKSTRLNSSH